MSVYKPCDIRGPVKELDPELYFQWGRALGAMTPADSVFVAGGDVRATTPLFLQALIEGLMEHPLTVVDLGVKPTPVIYFAKRYARAGACAIVTASHMPADHNGLKWMIDNQPATGQQVRALESAAANRDSEGGPSPRSSHIVNYVVSEYGRWLETAFAGSSLPEGMTAVVDAGNGCWSVRARHHLRALFPGLRVVALNDEEDGAFPNRSPDVARPECLQELRDTVMNEGAGIGLAFDGDGDRVAFVDEEGVVLSAEEATWVLLQTFGDALRNRAFVHDIKLSDRVAEAAGELGARVVPERSGHAFIRARMLKENALFGAEISGHYFHETLEGGDDGLFTACRLLAWLGRTGESLGALRQRCPRVHMTPDFRVAVPDRDAFIKRVRTRFAGRPQSAVDGVRVNFPKGWALARASVTEPRVTLRFEGESRRDLAEIVEAFCEALGEEGRDLRRLFQTKE